MGLDWDFDVDQDEIELLAICIFILFLAYFLVYEICKRFGICSCRQRKRNQPYQPIYSSPVVVTSQSHAPQGTTVVQGGYYPPMAPGNAPQGGVVYPPQGGYQPGQYPQYPPAQHPQQPIQPPHQPYPVHQNAPVVGVQPPAGYNENPPSYDQVQQDNTMYTKQPPYNPSYTGQQ